MPKKDDQEYVKIIKRFRELHEDTKSTAVKARMEIKKRLFIMIMSVIVAIRKLKYGHKNQMKAERSKAYLMDKRSLTKEDIVTEAKSYVRDKGMGDDSFEKVDI